NVLLKGVKITNCPGCGEGGVAIPKIDQLHEVLVEAIARKSQRLEPAEIKFLRKYLGWSGLEFASRIGVTPETVSRWEHGARPMGSTAEILLRFSAIALSPLDEYPVPEFVELQRSKPLRLQLGKDWSVVA
ncbi:type II TA system antitoxin MqsA family protein, partial [Gemmatimonadota bacterium]